MLKIAARFKKCGWLYRIGTFTNGTRYGGDFLGIKNEDINFYGNKLWASFFVIPYQMFKDSSKIDVFYVASTHWYTVIPSLVARIIKKKVVLGVTLSMTDSPASRPNKLLKKPYYWFKNIQFKFASFIFVNSPLLAEECKSCGYGDDVIKLINNPVDTSKYYPVSKEEKKRLRIQKALNPDSLTILFVGSFNKRKGCDILPAIFDGLFSKFNIRVNFVMCGQKGYPETEGILATIKNCFNGTGNQLLIEEEVRNTAPYYQMADLFLFPTTNEGMPNVILEAMSSGCMILCNTLLGITDFVLDDDFLVTENNITEYIAKIGAYYKNPNKYKKGIEANREVIEKKFSITSVDNSIKEVLRS